MRDYIVRIVAAAMICAAVGILLPPKHAAGQITKLLSGVLLLVTVISPLAGISFRNITDYFDGLSLDADSYVEEGSAAMQEQFAAIIKAESESYILDKAGQMGLQISVEVALDEDNNSIPCGVKVTGQVSAYSKKVLSDYITDTLGIAKEKQVWISKD